MKTRVLIVEDSRFLCKLLRRYLESAADFEVCGEAHDGRSALELARATRPDVVSLDLTLPDMPGLKVLEALLKERGVPVLVLTGATGTSAQETVHALEAGAVDFVLKFDPAAPLTPDVLAQEIVTKLRRAAQKGPQVPGGLVVIGASTGGPGALRDLLGKLPSSFPTPVVVVQHVPAAFSGALAQDLRRSCALQTAEARAGQKLGPGVFVAPGGSHVEFDDHGGIRLSAGNEDAYCPSIDVTMESAAERFRATATGILLTGMGHDGVKGMAAIQRAGGRTLAQEPSSCVVAGMPAAAIRQGVVAKTGTPSEIGERIVAEEMAHAQ
jgi:two-component system chemotaxis response regulator CheB